MSRVTERGDRVELVELGPGRYVGEIGLIEDIPRTATVTAVEPTSVLAFDAATFAEVVSDAETGADVRQAARERMSTLP